MTPSVRCTKTMTMACDQHLRKSNDCFSSLGHCLQKLRQHIMPCNHNAVCSSLTASESQDLATVLWTPMPSHGSAAQLWPGQLRHETTDHYQSTCKAHAKVLENLIVSCLSLPVLSKGFVVGKISAVLTFTRPPAISRISAANRQAARILLRASCRNRHQCIGQEFEKAHFQRPHLLYALRQVLAAARLRYFLQPWRPVAAAN